MKTRKFLTAAALMSIILTFVFSSTANADTNTFTTTHNGYTLTLYTSFNNTTKVASASTKHPINSTKTAKITGVYKVSGIYYPITGAEAISFTSETPISSVANTTGYNYCGAISSHTVYYTSGYSKSVAIGDTP